MRGIKLILLLSMASFHLFGQKTERPKHYLKAAKHAVRMGDQQTAIKNYSKYVELKPEHNQPRFDLGLAYFSNYQFDQAETQFKYITDIAEDEFPLAYYYQAEIARMRSDMDAATDHYSTFRKLYRNGKDASFYRRKVKMNLDHFESRKSFGDTAIDLQLKPFVPKLQNQFSESAPQYVNNGVLFTVTKVIDDQQVREFIYTDTSTGRSELIVIPNGSWSNTAELNNPFYNEREKRLYFCACNREYDLRMRCDIFFADGTLDKLGTPVKMPKAINKPNATNTQPAIGRDVKYDRTILYFVSDRKDGRGGKDIWYSYYDKRNEVWKPARNAGGKINTPGDEVTPWYDQPTGTLYFSSDFHGGYGNQDIFSAEGQKSRWSAPENLGKPMNGPADETYFVHGVDPSEGIFATNRNASEPDKVECCDQLVNFELNAYVYLTLRGSVYNEEKPPVKVSGAKVYVSIYDEEEQSWRGLEMTTTDENGKFDFPIRPDRKYKVEISSEGYLISQSEFKTDGMPPPYFIEKDFFLEPITEAPILLPIYYEFDKWDLNSNATKVIDSLLLPLLELNSNINIELASHTDSKGTEKYNQYLSQKRAESVVKYLIQQGISEERLKAIGYGESKPIATNENADGSDNSEGRAKNRRTEFTVVKTQK